MIQFILKSINKMDQIQNHIYMIFMIMITLAILQILTTTKLIMIWEISVELCLKQLIFFELILKVLQMNEIYFHLFLKKSLIHGKPQLLSLGVKDSQEQQDTL